MGGFWTDELVKALREEACATTLGDVYMEAERRYWEANADLKKQNALLEASEAMHSDDQPPDDAEANTVGTVGCEAGLDGRSAKPMHDVPVKEFANQSRESSV